MAGYRYLSVCRLDSYTCFTTSDSDPFIKQNSEHWRNTLLCILDNREISLKQIRIDFHKFLM